MPRGPNNSLHTQVEHLGTEQVLSVFQRDTFSRKSNILLCHRFTQILHDKPVFQLSFLQESFNNSVGNLFLLCAFGLALTINQSKKENQSGPAVLWEGKMYKRTEKRCLRNCPR